MAEESVPDSIGKIFGHRIINWKIENIALFSFKGDYTIHSPEICISETNSTWKLFLALKSKTSDGDFCADIYLQRLESPGPDNVRANWKLRLLHDQCEEYSKECELNFVMNSSFGINFLTTAFFQQLTAPNEDTLNIQCQLIVSNIDDDRDFEQCDEYGLIALSQDLRALYMDSKYKDIVIRTKNGEIRAHKVVLYYRNRILAKLIDEAIDGPIVLEIDNEAVETVIKYVYSSYLGFVLSKPSISMYECIKYLNIEEVMWYYEPAELILHTKVDVCKISFQWTLKKFENRTQDCFSNPILDKEDSGTNWRVDVYPKFVTHDKRLAIYVNLVEGITPIDVSIELSVMNNNSVILASGRITKTIKLNESIAWKGFVSKEILKNSLKIDNSLTFHLKFRISKGNIYSSCGCKPDNEMYKYEKQNYQYLSSSMECMREFPKFPDIHLVPEKNSFPAHMCILAARSPTFAAMIDKMDKKQPYLYMRDMPSDILQNLLHYIYCGALKRNEIIDPLQMYEVSDRFAIYAMRHTCANILTSGVGVENACSMLILANEKGDQDFKSSIMKFVYNNISEIFKQESWKNLTTKIPLLSEEVLNYVKSESDKLISATETQETGTNISSKFTNILTSDE